MCNDAAKEEKAFPKIAPHLPGFAPCIDADPIISVRDVSWRLCRFRTVEDKEVGFDTPRGPIRLELPRELESAVPARRSEFLAGRLCAQLALEGAGGSGKVGRCGRRPVWPEGVSGSISHSKEMALAVAVSGRRGIGVDILHWLSSDVAAEIESIVLTEADQALKPAGWRQADFVSVMFSAKESLYKALDLDGGDIPEFSEAELAAPLEGRVPLTFRGRTFAVEHARRPEFCVTLALI